VLLMITVPGIMFVALSNVERGITHFIVP